MLIWAAMGIYYNREPHTSIHIPLYPIFPASYPLKPYATSFAEQFGNHIITSCMQPPPCRLWTGRRDKKHQKSEALFCDATHTHIMNLGLGGWDQRKNPLDPTRAPSNASTRFKGWAGESTGYLSRGPQAQDTHWI
jgi:hypothetical protein